MLIPSLLVLHPSALPILFQEELMNKEATEGEAVTLHCKLSKSAPVEWKKGNMVLKPSEKYKIEKEGPFVELTIQDLELADAGDYSCVCGDRQTTAALAVNGKKEILSACSKSACVIPRYLPLLLLLPLIPMYFQSSFLLINFPILSSFSLLLSPDALLMCFQGALVKRKVENRFPSQHNLPSSE